MKLVSKRNIFLVLLAALGYFIFQMKKKIEQLQEEYENCLLFKGKQISFEEDQEFYGDSIAAVFSGIEIDLSNATLTDDSATLELYGEFSGISIKVPSEWNVKVEGNAEKSGIDNHIEFDEEDQDSPVLYINYDLRYAGLEIKN